MTEQQHQDRRAERPSTAREDASIAAAVQPADRAPIADHTPGEQATDRESIADHSDRDEADETNPAREVDADHARDAAVVSL
ncbi:hypothetical protein GV791_32470, partial [Nocardia cyriacigeorgica]